MMDEAVDGGCDVKAETRKKTRRLGDRRESFPYITDKALDIQQKTLKHKNKIATHLMNFSQVLKLKH